MKTFTKLLCLLLVAAFCLGLAACGGSKKNDATEAATDKATTPVTEKATTPATEPAATDAATDKATTPAATDAATDKATTPAATEAATDAATDKATTPAATDPATEPATDKATTPAATEPATEKEFPDITDEMTHQEISDALYEYVLGDFYAEYMAAKEETNLSKKYAMMAIAEAKLLEAGVLLPSTANGGTFAISRVVPYTVTPCLWGNDSYRYHQVLAVDGDPLTPAERDELKALWKNAATSDEYETAAKAWLAAKGYKTKTTYTIGYTSDPSTWDAQASYYAVDAEPVVNTYDGLLEYDLKGNTKFALATDLEVSDDGLNYTFTIREGVKWVDSQNNILGEVTAEDFVNGLRHVMDVQGGLEYLIDGVILNAAEYMAGEVEFDEVGVKANGNKVTYTLTAPTSYFDTMFGYTIFAPLCTSYFLAKGGAFGEDYDAATCTYGLTSDDIAYCGPYIVTSHVDKNTIVFDLNQNYWNKDNVNVTKIVWLFADTTDATWAYSHMKDGTLSGSGLNTSALQLAKTDKVDGTDKYWFDTYAYVSSLDASSYPVFFNLHRTQYANHNDDTKVVSQMTGTEKTRANTAMKLQSFRLAVAFALDRGAFNAAQVGEEVKYNSLVNSYTPGNFIALKEDVTVKINGVDTTFPAGTFYGAIMQAQITADGAKMKVWDPDLEGGLGSSTGFDGWYSIDNARAELAKAIDELAAMGIEVTAENPIVLELPYLDIRTDYANRSNALKQSIEASLEGKVVIRLIETGGSNAANWYHAGYYPQTGDKMNYNLTDVCGWGPDYGDPSTYLDTMLPQGGGMAKNLGMY